MVANMSKLATERKAETMVDVSPYDDVIDVRDVIARYEELRASWADSTGDNPDDYALSGDDLKAGLDDEESAELELLTALLADLKGNGGDEQWQGDWYPVTLIRDSYFVTYAQELADDIGLTNAETSWPYTCIDWEKAAREMRMDYTAVEFDGVTFWTR